MLTILDQVSFRKGVTTRSPGDLAINILFYKDRENNKQTKQHLRNLRRLY